MGTLELVVISIVITCLILLVIILAYVYGSISSIEKQIGRKKHGQWITLYTHKPLVASAIQVKVDGGIYDGTYVYSKTKDTYCIVYMKNNVEIETSDLNTIWRYKKTTINSTKE